jgi:hypothetical protein
MWAGNRVTGWQLHTETHLGRRHVQKMWTEGRYQLPGVNTLFQFWSQLPWRPPCRHFVKLDYTVHVKYTGQYDYRSVISSDVESAIKREQATDI